MITINLNNLEGIPDKFLKELKKFDSIFRDNINLENILEEEPIDKIMQEINHYCKTQKIVGFHYTRAIPEEISKTGLTCRSGEEIRNTFISKHGHIFTKDEIIKIKRRWINYFHSKQQKSRDNYIFFNFTTCALNDSGAEPLLSNFGGEQIYMPIQGFDEIGEKIRKIGKPLILKCILNPTSLNTFYEYPWGRIAISTYHCKINPKAIQNDEDGYQNISVNSDNIEIIECTYYR